MDRTATGREADVTALPDYQDYAPLAPETVGARLAALDGVAARLGGEPEDWRVREVGDGNLNFVFLVDGPKGSVCVKQALPYVRLVGESWPLPLSRSFFEHAALTREAERSDEAVVPAVHAVDHGQALVVMEKLDRHVIWRKALIRRERHETAAPVIGRFMAETLFRSSELCRPADAKKAEAALFAQNTELCKITEDLVFTHPYHEHELNRWTSPDLDETVRAIRSDDAWLVAIQDLKWAFLTRAEALIHGDLHTGSVMVAKDGDDEDIRVIDPEFAFYGPMGFDVGAILANLFLSCFAQDGYDGEAAPFQEWLLDQVVRVWDAFEARFAELWRSERTGPAYPRAMYEDQGNDAAVEAALQGFLARVRRDSLGFAGAKMARRILGLAHVEDLEVIEPAAKRAACERRALKLARTLIVERAAIDHPQAACERARLVLGERD